MTSTIKKFDSFKHPYYPWDCIWTIQKSIKILWLYYLMFTVTICVCGKTWQNKKQQQNRSLSLKTLESYFTELDPMTKSCKRLQISLMLSAAYVSSTAQQSSRWNTHSYTQGCRLHNALASWNASQYYWLAQDTGSSQRSSWKDPVPSLLACLYLPLSQTHHSQALK